jgi:biotin carboxylase
VINPVAAYRFEKSKALQLDPFERLGVRHPRAVVVNHPDQVLKALDRRVSFRLLVKPSVGGSGAGIVRFDSRDALESALKALDLRPDHTALLQEYVEPEGQAIVPIEVLVGRFLYAIRIVKETESRFHLCPADLCEAPGQGLSACPVGATTGIQVARFEPPSEAIEAALGLTRAASIAIDGVEYLVGKADGQRYFYDINATSNFVADAPTVLGFDPFPVSVDFIAGVAARCS